MRERVTGPVDRAAQKIAQARFADLWHQRLSRRDLPLRLSYGKVGGWSDNGVTVPPFTYYGACGTAPPASFPSTWRPAGAARKAKVNPGTVFDFVSDNDIIGGNSGSPAINAKGEVVGAIFDGNIESLGGAFGFDGRVNRAVSVSTAAITEALKSVYGDQALVTELTSH